MPAITYQKQKLYEDTTMSFTREQIKEMGLSKAFVLTNYPNSYPTIKRGNVDIRRPRTENDPSALVNYVLLSGYHLTNKTQVRDSH
jgi:hypothetical protein